MMFGKTCLNAVEVVVSPIVRFFRWYVAGVALRH